MRLLEDSLTYLTDAHVQVIKILERWGFEIQEEVEFPPYCVDVYIPDFHVAVEVDGPQHEKSRDVKRDATLLDIYALPVFRITITVVGKSEKWARSFAEFIDEWRDDVENRWEFCRDRTPWL